MTDADHPETRPSLDTVIRGFTDAELALREIAGAVERFRAASAQLSEAREDQAAARHVLEETTSAAKQIADRVEVVIGTLSDTVAVLRLLDPDRLWRQLGVIESEARTAAANTVGRLDAVERITRRGLLIAAAGGLIGLLTLGVLVGIITGTLAIP